MSQGIHTNERIASANYEFHGACSLFNPDHTIRADAAAVVETLRDMDDFTAVASGCNGCTQTHIERGVYYVAQHGNPSVVYFGYSDMVAAHTLIGVCERLDVPYDWTGDVSKKVAVGAPDVYDD